MDAYLTLFMEKIKNEEPLTKKQQDILNTCVELFAEKGFANTSTSDIAKGAEVAEGTIYKHFGTKQNLLYATILPIFTNILFKKLLGEFATAGEQNYRFSFAELIHHLLFDQFHLINDNHKVLKIFVSEIMYQDNARQDLLQLIPVELIQGINDLLDHYKTTDQIVDWDNQSIIRLILSPIISYVFLLNSILPDEQLTNQQELENIEHFIIKGLAK